MIHTLSLICTGIVVGLVFWGLYQEWRNNR